MHPTAHPGGWIEVICGCMFSGKTEELIRRLVRARYARQEAVVFKPSTDVRYAEEAVVTHSKVSIPCRPVDRASAIPGLVGDAQVVGIDEAQFFDHELVEVCERLANAGKRVIVAGLDQDFRGRPFEPIPSLLAVAEHITKAHAICTVCGAPANRSQRLVNREAVVLLGADDAYEARCRLHFNPDPFEAEQPSFLASDESP